MSQTETNYMDPRSAALDQALNRIRGLRRVVRRIARTPVDPDTHYWNCSNEQDASSAEATWLIQEAMKVILDGLGRDRPLSISFTRAFHQIKVKVKSRPVSRQQVMSEAEAQEYWADRARRQGR